MKSDIVFDKEMMDKCHSLWIEAVRFVNMDSEDIVTCIGKLREYLGHKIRKNLEKGLPAYNVEIFNACYTKWMRQVLEVTRNRETVEICDLYVAKKIGIELANKLLKHRTEFANTHHIGQLLEAISYTHWFQEDVKRSQLYMGEDRESIRLEVENCSWQSYWHGEHGQYYPQCFKPHAAMLTNFCKKICPQSKVNNLIEPGLTCGCAWEISITK